MDRYQDEMMDVHLRNLGSGVGLGIITETAPCEI